ncbi:large ribosomal subunit protein eL14 [Bacillus rossius redtenbacheri]|uniref:large ribosomal subunit protein eL14 n=1 Tax=Bacillus rossius redtenbacheri TaxID=93214 RepID=UPI002FDD3C1D
MPFQRFVEPGRIAYVSDGVHKGKLVTIVDVIDQTRALVDGPESGVPRRALRLNQLYLTKLRVKFAHSASTRVVRKAWRDGKVDEEWKKTTWAGHLESKRRRSELTDFDRFKLRKVRQLRNKIRSQAFFSLKKAATKAGTLYKSKRVLAHAAKKKDAPKKKK